VTKLIDQNKPTKSRRTQEQRKSESERKIIIAAIELFARQGYMRTTMTEVGKAAGYTGGLVSHRFKSKEGLLKAVVTSSLSSFLDDQIRPGTEAGELSAEQAINKYVEIYLSEVFVRGSSIRALYVIMGEALGAIPEIRPPIAQLNKSTRHILANIIQQGIDAGEFNNTTDPNDAAVIILGLIRGVVMQYLTDSRSFNRKKILPLIQSSALACLR
jgi:AcrR family transcriptional regulator